MWWLPFVVPFACGGFCLWCLLRAWRACVHGVALSLHGGPRIQSCTQHWKTELQFSGGVVQICFCFFSLCCIQLSTTSRKFTPLSYPLLHLFRITSAVLRRCFVASALLQPCFYIASVLPPRCFGVASASLRRSFGFGVAPAACAATSLQLRCNFGSTLAQQCVRPNQNLTASCSDAHLCNLGVACSLQDGDLLKALNTFRFFNHERHNNTCFEVYWT